jgi:hypothetical protein
MSVSFQSETRIVSGPPTSGAALCLRCLTGIRR